MDRRTRHFGRHRRVAPLDMDRQSDALKAAPREAVTFRYAFTLAALPSRASLLIATHGDFTATVNGQRTGPKKDWSAFDNEDLRPHLHVSVNDILITVAGACHSENECVRHLAVVEVEVVRRGVVRFQDSQILRPKVRVGLLARMDREQKREIGVIRVEEIHLAEVLGIVAWNNRKNAFSWL